MEREIAAISQITQKMLRSTVEECSDSFSDVMGYLSIYCWLVAQIPQQVENYRNKRCDGISFSFLMLWFLGDITSLIGCILTNQLAFQIYLAIYFLYNDAVLFSQWYYYTHFYKHKHTLHHHHHHHPHPHHQANHDQFQFTENTTQRETDIPVIEGISINGMEQINNNKSAQDMKLSNSGKTRMALVAASMASLVQGAPVDNLSQYSAANTVTIGVAISWICAALYLGARVPQLYKNFQRKSVDGISPLLFFTAIMANLCYSSSIILSCRFNYAYFINALPYIVGSAGTIIFDLAYFYQRWLYDATGANKAIYEESDELTRLL